MNLVRSALLGALAPVLGAQTPVLHYKFDAGAGARAINYASASGIAPAEGTLTSNYPWGGSWTPGRFGGSALFGSHFDPTKPGTRTTGNDNYLDTGWDGRLQGSFSVAWFMKERVNPGQAASYLFSGVSSFRCYTNGIAQRGLYLRGWGDVDLPLAYDIQSAARLGWVHVAIVVDHGQRLATWYVNGQAQPPLATFLPPNVAPGIRSFTIGQHLDPTESSCYDLDEFRLQLGAAPAAVILEWSKRPQAAAGVYGKGCGAALAASAPPRLASSCPLDLAGAPGSAFFLSLGLQRHKLGALALPFDVGPMLPAAGGCPWESSLTLALGGGLDAAGKGRATLLVPGDPVLAGAALFAQGLLVAPGGQGATTGGLALSLGH